MPKRQIFPRYRTMNRKYENNNWIQKEQLKQQQKNHFNQIYHGVTEISASEHDWEDFVYCFDRFILFI